MLEHLVSIETVCSLSGTKLVNCLLRLIKAGSERARGKCPRRARQDHWPVARQSLVLVVGTVHQQIYTPAISGARHPTLRSYAKPRTESSAKFQAELRTISMTEERSIVFGFYQSSGRSSQKSRNWMMWRSTARSVPAMEEYTQQQS